MALLGMGAIGLFMFGQVSQRAAVNGWPALPWTSPLPDGLLLAVGAALGLATPALALFLFVREARRGAPPSVSWWRSVWALWVALPSFGAGVGAFGAWLTEVGTADAGGGLSLLLLVAAGAVLVATERGKAPILALTAAVATGTLVAFARLLMGGFRERYAPDALLLGIVLMLAAPVGFMVLRALLELNQRTAVPRREARGRTPLPVEVVVQDGSYVVVVEAPGLADTAGVEAQVEGPTLRLLVPRPAAPAAETVFTTRASGRFPVEVQLPRLLQDPPWSVGVEHGLLRVQVAPVGE